MKPADIDEIISKAEDAYAKREHLEEKIRVASMRHLRKSPREIIKRSDEIQKLIRYPNKVLDDDSDG